jgi:energy-coupling factor transporter transmembrane protein EcfT
MTQEDQGQEFAYSFRYPQYTGNFLFDMHPFVKLNIMVILCITNFVLREIYFSLGLILGSLLFAFLSGKLKTFFKIYWKVFLFFGVFWFLFKAAFLEGETVLFQFAGIQVTEESIRNSLSTCLLVLGFSSFFILFFQVTPMSKLILSLEQLGLPHTGGFIFLSTFQTIADISDNCQAIMESQKARGIETEGNVFIRLKAYIPVLGPLVLNAVAGTEEKTIAMEARAFSSPRKPSQLCILPKVRWAEIILVVMVYSAFIGSIVLKIITRI